ncbi:MAG: HPP family protein [Hyphomicrobiaceae bacterium]
MRLNRLFRLPTLQHPRRALTTALGGAIGILLMVLLADVAGIPLISVPFATSVVLVMAAPESELTQPRNILGGHLVSSACGLVVLHIVGGGPWTAPIAVGISILVMQLTRTLHPPAGGDGLVVVVEHAPWHFLLVPTLAGALLLISFAWGYHRLVHPGIWPRPAAARRPGINFRLPRIIVSSLRSRARKGR